MRRHARQIRFRDLDEIAEDGIEPDLERFDAGLGDLAFLQLRDPVLPLARPAAQLIEVGVEAVAKNAAFLQRQRRIIDDRLRSISPASSGISRSSIMQSCASDSASRSPASLSLARCIVPNAELARSISFCSSAFNSGICSSEIFSATRSRALPEAWLEPARRPLKIADRFQRFAKLAEQIRLVQQIGDQLLAALQFGSDRATAARSTPQFPRRPWA